MGRKALSALMIGALLTTATAPAFAGDDRHWRDRDDRIEDRYDRWEDRRDWREDRWERRAERRWDDRRWDDRRWDDRRGPPPWARGRGGPAFWDDRGRVIVVDRRPVYVDRRPIYAAPPRWTRYEDPYRGYVVYRDRPDVVFVHGRPYRTWYDPRRQGYYYRDNNGRDVLLGVALGAIGLAAVLAATR
jgi:hypothetical protein